MTGLIFTPGFMKLLTSFPILFEGGGHKHCNLIRKLLTLALSVGLLVAHRGCIGVCLKVGIAKICVCYELTFKWILAATLCLVLSVLWYKTLSGISERSCIQTLNSKVFSETEIHISYPVIFALSAKGWKQSQAWPITAEQTSAWNIKYFFALWLSR